MIYGKLACNRKQRQLNGDVRARIIHKNFSNHIDILRKDIILINQVTHSILTLNEIRVKTNTFVVSFKAF